MNQKSVLVIFLLLVLSLFTACGNQSAISGQSASKDHEASASTKESATETSAETSSSTNSLIIYFDYSENMGDTSGMSTDAVTSASLAGDTIDGITRNNLLVMKDEIQKQTGSDVYPIQITDPYDPDYGNMVNGARDDQNEDKQFQFTNDLGDLSAYSTIYLGMPVWWSHLPQPVASFLEQTDLSGKTIIPFGIHLGSGFGQMIEQIQQLEPNATVDTNGLTINSHTPNADTIAQVDSWLASRQ